MRNVLRGNGIAIGLGALAVVLAATGTAVAVAASQVNIVDATSAKAAKVDNAGRLSTTEPTTTIHAADLLTGVGGENTFVTSPTTATLAITKLDLSNPSINAAAAFAEVRVYVYQVDVTGTTTCDNPSNYQLMAVYNVAPGDDITNTFATPLVVSRHGSTKYCITLYGTTLGGTYSASYLPAYAFGAYAVTGAYSGLGASAQPGAAGPARVGRTDR